MLFVLIAICCDLVFWWVPDGLLCLRSWVGWLMVCGWSMCCVCGCFGVVWWLFVLDLSGRVVCIGLVVVFVLWCWIVGWMGWVLCVVGCLDGFVCGAM